MPSVVIATDPFRPTVDATAEVLGMSGMRLVYAPHPVSRLDDVSFRQLAERLSSEIVELLGDV